MKSNTVLIIGAGLAGSTVARVLAENNYCVHVIDRRDHIGGNCYDYTDSYGIRIHKYGPHLFHTNNSKVFNWLSRFTEWVQYTHRVVCLLENGIYVPFPVNQTTLKYIPNNPEYIYDVFYRRYTKKMWGTDIVDTSVINRVKIREDSDDRYFKDQAHQCLPKDGYTKMILNMLTHPNIKIQVGTSYTKNIEHNYRHCFSSQAIDEYYDYCYGKLPYRSIIFNNVTIPVERVANYPQINFTDNGPYTRFSEWKNLPNHGSNPNFTTLTFETPCCYSENNDERYYPIKNDSNIELYKRYRSIPNPHMTFIGRCGQYVYMDMDMAVASSLAVAKRYLDSV